MKVEEGKYSIAELVDWYLRAYETPREVRLGLTRYCGFYNAQRPHQSIEYRTPDELYFGTNNMKKAA